MPSLKLIAIVTAVTLSVAPAATVSFSSGSSFTLFESGAGGALVSGYLHAGYFTTSPIGLTPLELQSAFTPWATLGNDSGPSGFFGNNAFPDTSIGAAAGLPIYLFASDTLNVGDATEIAVFTNPTLPGWVFPASDFSVPASVSLDDVRSLADGEVFLAGSNITAGLTGGAGIGLVAIPEPSVVLLGFVGAFGFLRRRR